MPPPQHSAGELAEIGAEFRRNGFTVDNIDDYRTAMAKLPGAWECGHRGAISLNRARVRKSRDCKACALKVKGRAHSQRSTENPHRPSASRRAAAYLQFHRNGFAPTRISDYRLTTDRIDGLWSCGHPGKVSLAKVATTVGACPDCAFAGRADKTRNDPDRVARLFLMNGIRLLEPYQDANRKMRGMCLRCGTVSGNYLLRYVQSPRGWGRGCRPCSDRFNPIMQPLSRDEVFDRVRAAGITPAPDAVYVNSSTKVPGVCNRCGWQVEVTLAVIGGGSRPRCGCTTSGYKRQLPGFMYLMERPAFGGGMEQQFGITNVPGHRIRQHQARGWQLLDIVGPFDGGRVADTELELKRWLRTRGIRMPQTAENWHTYDLEVSSVEALSAVTGVRSLLRGSGRIANKGARRQ
jgi:hypothetical protein